MFLLSSYENHSLLFDIQNLKYPEHSHFLQKHQTIHKIEKYSNPLKRVYESQDLIAMNHKYIENY